jgi:NAD-reducing hydrogenase small subunit
MSKKKIATVWLSGCSGCHMSLLDIDERLLDLIQLADLVKSPIVDGKTLPEVDITLVEGAVASQEHLTELKHIREKSKLLVALGDCAVTGNVSAIRNLVGTREALQCSYKDVPSNVPGSEPQPGHGISLQLKHVQPLHTYVRVDHYIRGCPPDADRIFEAVRTLLTGFRQPPPSERKTYG